MPDLPVNQIIHGDCLEVMRSMPDGSVDAVVTDCPYGLNFMGQHWDDDCPQVEVWRECLRVLKPGAHLLAFSGTRTVDLVMGRIREAGFEIRDTIMWLYGSGFPKSLDISKAIDKAAGAERETLGPSPHHCSGRKPTNTLRAMRAIYRGDDDGKYLTAPATPAAVKWQGWGTALKPACEPITVARKPFSGTVAGNVLKHGTGAINVDGCRIEFMNGDTTKSADSAGRGAGHEFHNIPGRKYGNGLGGVISSPHGKGRWPANVVLDEAAAECLDEMSGETTEGNGRIGGGEGEPKGIFGMGSCNVSRYPGTGGASRFFYTAKSSRSEREAGLRVAGLHRTLGDYPNHESPSGSKSGAVNCRNIHPTVKPLSLMRWLVRLVTPPDGLVLDPFAGSGTTLIAASLEGFKYLGIELNPEYVRIAEARIAEHTKQGRLI